MGDGRVNEGLDDLQSGTTPIRNSKVKSTQKIMVVPYGIQVRLRNGLFLGISSIVIR
jgi:hypothetical protein